MMLAGGIGMRCFKCETWVTYDDLFRALNTTALAAMDALEAEWERQERCAEVANAMERSAL